MSFSVWCFMVGGRFYWSNSLSHVHWINRVVCRNPENIVWGCPTNGTSLLITSMPQFLFLDSTSQAWTQHSTFANFTSSIYSVVPFICLQKKLIKWHDLLQAVLTCTATCLGRGRKLSPNQRGSKNVGLISNVKLIIYQNFWCSCVTFLCYLKQLIG